MHEFVSKLGRLELPQVATALGAGAAVASFAGGGRKILIGALVTAAGLAWAASRLPCCTGCAAGQGCGGTRGVLTAPSTPTRMESARSAGSAQVFGGLS